MNSCGKKIKNSKHTIYFVRYAFVSNYEKGYEKRHHNFTYPYHSHCTRKERKLYEKCRYNACELK